MPNLAVLTVALIRKSPIISVYLLGLLYQSLSVSLIFLAYFARPQSISIPPEVWQAHPINLK